MKSKLKRLRTEAGYTLQTIGDMCGITKSHMHDLEKESGSSPKLTTAYAIAKVLDKSVYDIWPDETEIIIETIEIRRVRKKADTTKEDSEGTMKYNDYEQVNGATVNALLERIEKLERMLIIINESWSVDDYVEGELFDEIIKEIGRRVDTHATTD